MRLSGAFEGCDLHRVGKNPPSRSCRYTDVCSVHSACDRYRIHVLTARALAAMRVEKASHYRPISQRVASMTTAMKRKIEKIITTW
jgi:hypothetical protein